MKAPGGSGPWKWNRSEEARGKQPADKGAGGAEGHMEQRPRAAGGEGRCVRRCACWWPCSSELQVPYTEK